MTSAAASEAPAGERFVAVYRIAGDGAEARARAEDLCLEQTVELPAHLVPAGFIREEIVGRIEGITPIDRSGQRVRIGFALATFGPELTQLLNLLFGNISLKPGIRLERLEPSAGFAAIFQGPRLGIAGWRERLGLPRRPLLCTALKPMGLTPPELADLAYRCALGGIDLIKDDHGLADQPTAPFRERVPRIAEAVARANRETGERALYLPNITGPADRMLDNAAFAADAGAGGLLVSPGITGLDAVRMLASAAGPSLPLMVHPAFQGSFVTHPDQGIDHYCLFGQLARLAGADASIFPSWGGRFSFSRDECAGIAAGCGDPFAGLRPIFPVPGGGMTLERLPEMLSLYGPDVVLLIGGGLYRPGPDLTANCRLFRGRVEAFAKDL